MSLNTILATAPLTTQNYHLKMIGTSIGNSLIWDNGTNVGIGNTNTSYTLDVSGTVRGTTSAYFSTASGSVGIGTILANKLGADKALTINGSTDSLLELSVGDVRKLQMYHGGTNAQLNNLAAGSLILITNGISVLTLASTGAATFANSAGITNGNGLNLRAGGNTSSDANVLNFTSLAGTINVSMFSDASSSNTRLKSLGNLSFHTGNIAISADNERMIIGSNGAVTITSSIAGEVLLNVQNTSSTGNGLVIGAGSTSSHFVLKVENYNGTLDLFQVKGDGTVKINQLTSNGTVATQSSNGTLYVSSDANLKIEDGYIENGLEKVLALKPRYFYWKDKEAFSADRQLGFYAQEVNAISEETANTPAEGCGWGIYDRGLVALLTAAIQEQQIQIQNLQEQLNILAK